MARLKSPRRPQRGLATLEMALILPLLLLLVFSTIEYGWMFYKNQQVAAAARAACRYAITAPATNAGTDAKITALMTQAQLQGSGFTHSPSNCEVLPGTFVTVTITVPYANLSLTRFPLPKPTNLVGSTTLPKEGPP
jgi:Flp pilus assembly protein TadG